MKRCFSHNSSEGSDENYDEERDLEIDLDYEHSIGVQIEPLDLSVKKLCDEFMANKPKLPILDINPIFNFANFEDKKDKKCVIKDNKGSIVTEAELASLLDPYVKMNLKKFSCTICCIKFISKGKAVSHVENKHVDCLQYKCPLCRASKGTRLAYESHLRRGHGARVVDHEPVIRSKKEFHVKSESQISDKDSQSGEQYDLQFVTFLREALCSEKEQIDSGKSWQRNSTDAEWIDQDQGIFRINNRHLFARKWSRFKVMNMSLFIQHSIIKFYHAFGSALEH